MIWTNIMHDSQIQDR